MDTFTKKDVTDWLKGRGERFAFQDRQSGQNDDLAIVMEGEGLPSHWKDVGPDDTLCIVEGYKTDPFEVWYLEATQSPSSNREPVAKTPAEILELIAAYFCTELVPRRRSRQRQLQPV